jgi:streptogramin lyase
MAQGPGSTDWFTEFGNYKIGEIDSLTSRITEHNALTFGSRPYDIVYDPEDGNLYFDEWYGNNIGVINPATGVVKEYPIPTPKAFPEMMTVDASGNVWFTEPSVTQIAMLSPSDPANIHEYAVPGQGGGIVYNPVDGNIWFSERVGSVPDISVFSPSSSTIIRSYTGLYGLSMTMGPDQNIWFTDGGIGMITTAGVTNQYAVPNASTVIITSAPDGNLWFTAAGTSGHPNVIGVVTFTAATIPTQLGVTTQPPAAVTSGKGFGLVVTVENAAGALDRDYTGSVTIALDNNPGADTLGGTLTATVQNGVAIFHGLTLHNADTGYTIQATAPGLTPVTTSPFNVTVGATALQVTPPPPAVVGKGLSFGLTISAIDGQDNADTSYNGPIALKLGEYPTGGTLGGTLVVGASNGVATFTGLSLSVMGNYTIVASARGLTSVTTATIKVAKVAPPITWANPADITYGTALGTAQLDATAPVTGSFAYIPPAGTTLGAGDGHPLSVTFTPDDTTDYTSATATVTINVLQATPVVSVNPVNLTYGTALADSQLSGTATWTVGGTVMTVDGSWSYGSALGTVLSAGAGHSESVTFTPANGTDYSTVSITVIINVAQATPVVSAASVGLTYGTALADSQLSGTATWTVGGTVVTDDA